MAEPALGEMICVDLVYADPDGEIVRRIEMPAGASVGDAIRVSGILDALPSGLVPAGLGIFGQHMPVGSLLRAGDRIEIYRPLSIDPMEARRQRVKKRKPK